MFAEGTYQARGELFVNVYGDYSSGYFVATTNNVVGNMLADVTINHLHAAQVSSSDLVGIWFDRKCGEVYVDRVLHVEHGQLAHALATYFNQKTIFSLTDRMVYEVVPTSLDALGGRK